MYHARCLFLISVCSVAVLLMSCGSSEESTQKQEQQSPPSVVTQKQQEAAAKTDTVNVNVQNTPKPDYDAKTPSPQKTGALPTGKFSIQIGAYTMADNAEHVALLARERFGKNVYTILDRVKNLYKVMVGDFSVKDEARSFRDDMAQKYPGDYKDAWVADNNQK